MKQTVKRDKHGEIVEQRARKSATYRKTFGRTLHQIDLALLVREMREDAGLTQAELAKKVGTTQSVIARLRMPNTPATRSPCWSASPQSAALPSSSMRRKSLISTVKSR